MADKFRNAIGIFINEVLSNEPMTIFGDGSQKRGFSYISDVAPLLAISPEVPKAHWQSTRSPPRGHSHLSVVGALCVI